MIETSDTLKHFFAISKQKINDDFKDSEAKIYMAEGDAEAAKRLFPSIRDCTNAKDKALVHHDFLVCTSIFYSRSKLNSDFFLFCQQVIFLADDACGIDFEKGRLQELNTMLAESEGDADTLSEMNLHLDKIFDTVFTHISRRYRRDDIANIFEGDRLHFNELFELGKEQSKR